MIFVGENPITIPGSNMKSQRILGFIFRHLRTSIHLFWLTSTLWSFHHPKGWHPQPSDKFQPQSCCIVPRPVGRNIHLSGTRKEMPAVEYNYYIEYIRMTIGTGENDYRTQFPVPWVLQYSITSSIDTCDACTALALYPARKSSKKATKQMYLPLSLVSGIMGSQSSLPM